MIGKYGLTMAGLVAATLAIHASSSDPVADCSLKTSMSASEFETAGLNKLTMEELRELDRWLNCNTDAEISATAPRQQPKLIVPASASAAGAATATKQAEPTYPLESAITGSFSGWSGDSRFVLENGQTWKQRNNERYTYSGTDKRISINKNFLGYYWLTLVATGEKVPVKLVK